MPHIHLCLVIERWPEWGHGRWGARWQCLAKPGSPVALEGLPHRSPVHSLNHRSLSNSHWWEARCVMLVPATHQLSDLR